MQCKTIGCESAVKARGFCNRCYGCLRLKVKYAKKEWSDFNKVHLHDITTKNQYAIKIGRKFERVKRINLKNEAIQKERLKIQYEKYKSRDMSY